MSIKLQPISVNHCELLFKWVNDASVRHNSFNSNMIEYGQHQEWFYNKLNSNNTKIFIITVNDIPIGQIRIDIEGEIGFIDYSIDKYWRGKGYGTKILKEIVALEEVNLLPIKKLAGKVKLDNIQSRRAFIGAGFSENPSENYLLYEKSIY